MRANLKTVSLETSERLLRLNPSDGHVEVSLSLSFLTTDHVNVLLHLTVETCLR